MIDAIAGGLNAVRDADDAFRATLDETQQKQLQQDGFDLTTQDSSILLTRFIAFAAAAPPSIKTDIAGAEEK